MSKNPDDYALVVGINDYPNYENLHGAIEDAQDFAKWLFEDSDGGGVPEREFQKVLSTPKPLRPIQEEIDDALIAMFQNLGRNRGRRFYLYFSGHGLGQSNLGADLCMPKWSKEYRRKAALDSMDYLKLILGSGKFDEVIFFLDCCRVRQIKASGLPSTLDFVRPGEIAGNGKYFIGYATEFQNSAYEAATANGSNGHVPTAVRGHFTRALMNALRGGASIASGGVPAQTLKEYLELYVPRIAAEHNHVQTPEVVNGLSAAHGALFGSSKPTRSINVKITFQARRAGTIVLEGPDLEEIERGEASTAPWRLHLERGWHALRQLNTGETIQFRVESVQGVSDVEF